MDNFTDNLKQTLIHEIMHKIHNDRKDADQPSVKLWMKRVNLTKCNIKQTNKKLKKKNE